MTPLFNVIRHLFLSSLTRLLILFTLFIQFL